MRKIFNLKLSVLSIFMFLSFISKGETNSGGPGGRLDISLLESCLSDTIPAVKSSTVEEESPRKKIKKVPKSRKQVKPITVDPNLPVKPIKIIKPKIIRRTVGSVGL